MAAASNLDTLGLLATAKMSPEAVAMRIHLAAEAIQRFSLPGVVEFETIEPGSDFYVPKLSRFGSSDVYTRYSKTTTDGSSFATTTNEGNSTTPAAISDSPFQMMQKFQEGVFKYDKVAWNRMDTGKRQRYVNGRSMQIARRLAREKDASVLSLGHPGLHASANEINSGGAVSFAESDIGAIYEIIENNFGTGMLIHLVLHTNQFPTIDAIKRFRPIPAAVSGEGAANRRRIYSDGDSLVIEFSKDVYDDSDDGYHGLFWVEPAISFQELEGMDSHDWFEDLENTFYARVETDYAYGLKDNTLAGTIQTPKSV